MRRSIWWPVLVTLSIWVAASTLPQVSLGSWRTGVDAAALLSPPSWPVPVLRDIPQPWTGRGRARLLPTWPGIAWRMPRVFARHATAPAPLAGPIAFARAERATFAALGIALALLFGMGGSLGVLALVRLLRGRAARWAGKVGALARRGMAPAGIARRSGLPRDVVRTLLAAPVAVRSRRRW